MNFGFFWTLGIHLEFVVTAIKDDIIEVIWVSVGFWFEYKHLLPIDTALNLYDNSEYCLWVENIVYGSRFKNSIGLEACMINTSLMRDHTSLLSHETLVITMNAWSQNIANVGLLIFDTQTKNNILSMTLKIDNATIEVNAQSYKSLMYVCCSTKQILIEHQKKRYPYN